MKLRRRREEKEKHCHHVLHHLSASPPRSALVLLLPSSFPSPLPPPIPTSPHRPAPACQPPRIGRAMPSSYPSPSCSTSPFLLHKITETAERGEKDRGRRPASWSSCNSAPSSPRPYPFIQSGGCPPAPVSRCDLSAAIGAIGKQRPKMRFPVLFPSLTNK